MAPNTHPVSILAGLQVLAVIAGTFAVRLMTLGYEDNRNIEWSATALFIRNFGWLLLGVPASWAIISLVLERRPEAIWKGWWTIASGLLLFMVLIAIFLQAMVSFSI